MKRTRILIVEDEVELAYPMSERLGYRGFEVKTATNWSDALKFFDNQKFDIAILDIKLPGMNGIELMKMIIHLQNDIKVILMSGHGTEEEAREYILLGAGDFMIKPIKMNNLINKINELILMTD